jgi:hypothetical protein
MAGKGIVRGTSGGERRKIRDIAAHVGDEPARDGCSLMSPRVALGDARCHALFQHSRQDSRDLLVSFDAQMNAIGHGHARLPDHR